MDIFIHRKSKFGSKNVIVFSLIFIFIIGVIILLINQKNIFIILAIMLSSFFGPIQSASRVYFAKSIPDEKKYEFFGFYSFSGKVTSFIRSNTFWNYCLYNFFTKNWNGFTFSTVC